MSTNNKRQRKGSALIIIGSVLIVLVPIIFLMVPVFFTELFCGRGDRCGYAGLGILGYTTYVAVGSFIIGLVLIIIGAILDSKK